MTRKIKHVVMWKVTGTSPAERAAHAERVKGELESMRGRVPGLLTLEVGIDRSGVDYACDVVLYSEFASQAALDAYAEHPEHIRVKRALHNLRASRHQVDYATG